MIARVFFLILFPSIVFSQSLTTEEEAFFFHKGQIISDSLVVFSNDHVWSYPLNNLSNPVKRPIDNQMLTFEGEDFQKGIRQFKTLAIDDEFYFVENKGGVVFKFENDSIKRIDRSFTHRMQIASNLFERDSKIFRFGGYGFWSYRNFFTYFSADVGEWEVVSPTNSNVFPEGIANALIALKNDEIILFGGRKQNPNDLTSSSFQANDIWHYDFKREKWKFLGEMMFDIDIIKGVAYLEDEVLVFSNDNHLIRILPFKNKVQRYKLTSPQYKMIVVYSEIALFKKDNKYYSFVKFDNIDKVELFERNEDEFFGELLDETKLYQDLSPWRYLLLLLVIPFIHYLRRFIITSKEANLKIIVNENGLTYKKVFFDFEPKELEVINLLLDLDVVHSSEILALVENPNHNYSHNMRTKNQLIDKINYKFKTMLKIDFDLITSEKSQEDKRIIDYRIDKSHF